MVIAIIIWFLFQHGLVNKIGNSLNILKTSVSFKISSLRIINFKNRTFVEV